MQQPISAVEDFIARHEPPDDGGRFLSTLVPFVFVVSMATGGVVVVAVELVMRGWWPVLPAIAGIGLIGYGMYLRKKAGK